MSAWGSDDDPTTPHPRPFDAPVVLEPARRTDSLMVALLVLVTFALAAIVMLAAVYSMDRAVEQLIQTPMCQETK